LFVGLLIQAELDEYRRDGVDLKLDSAAAAGNQPILDLIEAPPRGIFDLLDDSCRLASDGDPQFHQRMLKTHGSHPLAKVDALSITIKHSLCDVSYRTEGFRSKNSSRVKFQFL
jgi:myosin heavy subunit